MKNKLPFRPEGPMPEPPLGEGFPITKALPRYQDLAYANASPAQKLDLYLPPGDGLFPLVLLVHGGAFMLGDKSHQMSKVGTDDLLRHGYAVANLNYRLSGEAKAPAQIQDIKAAVRWLRAHAGEYALNTARFGAWGASAGGNLVALLGTSAGVAALEGSEFGNPQYSSAVQAVVDWFGPTDFLKMDEQFAGKPHLQTHNAPDSPESLLIGAPIQTVPDLVRAVNPITYISPNAAPFLIQHGVEDDLVPMQQSQILSDALLPVLGAEKVSLALFAGTGHGGGVRFWGEVNMEVIVGFLDRFLK